MERPRPSTALENRRAEHQKLIDAARAELARIPGDNEEARKQQTAAVEKLEKEMPELDLVMAVQEGTIDDLPVHLRGNHLKPGPEKIPRGMPQILAEVNPPAVIPASTSGRLELAQWLVSPQQPLTRRVLMNRIWMWHFGRPLMTSPSNWGLQAAPPTHPELLDWLAQELVRRNWSLKEMHRVIMLSATWQMSSECDESLFEKDPENRLLARQNRRRLEAEPVRDSILFVGGGLDLTMEGMAPSPDANRRAIYLPIDRAALYEMFSTFDYVETANHIEQRPVTTVPNQALFLMNSRMVHEQARRLIETLPTSDPQVPLTDSAGPVSSLFQILYGRLPNPQEVVRSIQFLEETDAGLSSVGDPGERRLQVWAALCRTLMAANEFIYVD